MNKYVFEILEHYVCCGGSDLHVSKAEAEIVEAQLGDYFEVSRPNKHKTRPYGLQRNNVEFSDSLLAAFWKLKYEEERRENNRLYDKITEFAQDFV